MKPIYFDHSATSFPKPEVVYQEMDRVARSFGVNAGRGGYNLARKSAELIEETRCGLADLVSLKDDQKVIITPSATISLNIVLHGIEWNYSDTVYISPFEHNSVIRPLEMLKEQYGFSVEVLPFDINRGAFNFEEIQELFLRKPPTAVVLTHASNVTGYILPVREINKLVKEMGGITIVDGAQALGSVDFKLDELFCDYYIFAGHKSLYGPIGVGGIYINTDELLKPCICGGTGSHSEDSLMPEFYPNRVEAGSPNVVAIGGLNASLKWLKENISRREKQYELLNELVKILASYPQINILGSSGVEGRVPVASCIFEGYTPNEIAMIFDEEFGIAVRPGLHCAPNVHRLYDSFPLGAVRFSLGSSNDSSDIDVLRRALKAIFD